MTTVLRLTPLLLVLVACAPRVVVRDNGFVYRPPAPGEPDAPETVLPPPRATPAPPPRDERIERVLETARSLVGKRKVRIDGRTHRADCSNFVTAVWGVVGIDLMSLGAEYPALNGVALIERYSERFGENHRHWFPSPGDIVYFDNTYDANRNGRIDDPLSHVGLVDAVDRDGTIHVIHLSRRGVVRDPMNLLRPDVRQDERGKTLNAWLRPQFARDRADVPRLAGQLFAGFGTIELPPVQSD